MLWSIVRCLADEVDWRIAACREVVAYLPLSR